MLGNIYIYIKEKKYGYPLTKAYEKVIYKKVCIPLVGSFDR